MNIVKTTLPDLLIVEPKVFEDDRGYFFESYNFQNYSDKGIPMSFIQDNQSKSTFGVIRGLHYQLAPFAQTKLVRVLEGTIFDVAVDIRKNSPTYKQWYGIELSGENKKQLLVPAGFAHGFSVLSPIAVVLYKCDALYRPEAERGIVYNDPSLKIDWKIDLKDAIVSCKDQVHPEFEKAETNFNFGKL